MLSIDIISIVGIVNEFMCGDALMHHAVNERTSVHR
jgi:hypothetical protein